MPNSRLQVRAPLLLPNGVRLVGAGMGKTALYFASMNNSMGNPKSLITNAEPGRFGLEDLDIYVLAFCKDGCSFSTPPFTRNPGLYLYIT